MIALRWMVHAIASHNFIEVKDPEAMEEDEQLHLCSSGKNVGQEQREPVVDSPDVKRGPNGAKRLQ